jgi:hypothetical protein
VALTLKPSNLSAKRNLELSLLKILGFGLGLSPRTTTAAPVPKDTDKAMLDYINANDEGHILTLEDPIEFTHPHKKCVVNQREIHVDCPSFAEGLRRALREDPDVILVGEMRDPETTAAAITVMSAAGSSRAMMARRSAAVRKRSTRKRPKP